MRNGVVRLSHCVGCHSRPIRNGRHHRRWDYRWVGAARCPCHRLRGSGDVEAGHPDPVPGNVEGQSLAGIDQGGVLLHGVIDHAAGVPLQEFTAEASSASRRAQVPSEVGEGTRADSAAYPAGNVSRIARASEMVIPGVISGRYNISMMARSMGA